MGQESNYDLLVLLQDTSRHMRTLGERIVKPSGLTRAQLTILARLQRQPDLSQNELASVLEVSAMTVARLVDRLEELGYVERCVDHDDRRVWRLRLTSAADPMLRELQRFRAKLYTIMTEGLDASALQALETGLRKMKANAQARLGEASDQSE